MKVIGLIGLVFIWCSCTAPRAVKDSGKVTPRGEFKAGYHVNWNVSTQTLEILGEELIDAAKAVSDDKDTVEYSVEYKDYNKALLAYSLDPILPSSEFYLNYGIYDRLEVGVGLGGSFIYELGYQFLGSIGSKDNPGEKGSYGSLGFQYSSQSYDLPSYLETVQSVFGYEFERKDYLGKLRFSKSYGSEETFGHFGYGFLLGYSNVHYGFNSNVEFVVDELMEEVDSEEVQKSLNKIPRGELNYMTYGGYLNTRFGYKWVYLVVGLATYYQNYGEIELLDGSKTKLSGLTIVPSWGIQANF